MEKLGDILKKYFSHINLDEKIREINIIELSKDILNKNFKINPEDINYDSETGVLILKIEDPVLKYELILMSDKIIKLINKKLNQEEIKKILVKV
ncbi:MAG TPA: DciA family protein [Spirochaetota bacterium]|nr:DciA family protein [Spirochaetota bacterium]HOM38575.1 DciA family protein [Spirochaetota bacterium]HPQ49712.1 DciA family protein [Spirochaetota bacterium]